MASFLGITLQIAGGFQLYSNICMIPAKMDQGIPHQDSSLDQKIYALARNIFLFIGKVFSATGCIIAGSVIYSSPASMAAAQIADIAIKSALPYFFVGICGFLGNTLMSGLLK